MEYIKNTNFKIVCNNDKEFAQAQEYLFDHDIIWCNGLHYVINSDDVAEDDFNEWRETRDPEDYFPIIIYHHKYSDTFLQANSFCPYEDTGGSDGLEESEFEDWSSKVLGGVDDSGDHNNGLLGFTHRVLSKSREFIREIFGLFGVALILLVLVLSQLDLLRFGLFERSTRDIAQITSEITPKQDTNITKIRIVKWIY